MTEHKDPVCEMTVEEGTEAGTYTYNGETYYFCSESCIDRFKENPGKFLAPRPGPVEIPVHADRKPANRISTIVLPIEGMSCASCVAKIEKSLSNEECPVRECGHDLHAVIAVRPRAVGRPFSHRECKKAQTQREYISNHMPCISQQCKAVTDETAGNFGNHHDNGYDKGDPKSMGADGLQAMFMFTHTLNPSPLTVFSLIYLIAFSSLLMTFSFPSISMISNNPGLTVLPVTASRTG